MREIAETVDLAEHLLAGGVDDRDFARLALDDQAEITGAAKLSSLGVQCSEHQKEQNGKKRQKPFTQRHRYPPSIS